MTVDILFQLSCQPWSQPACCEWPRITPFHTHPHTHTYMLQQQLIWPVATYNFSFSSIFFCLSSTSTTSPSVMSLGILPTLHSHPRFTCSPLDTRRCTGKATDQSQCREFPYSTLPVFHHTSCHPAPVSRLPPGLCDPPSICHAQAFLWGCESGVQAASRPWANQQHPQRIHKFDLQG